MIFVALRISMVHLINSVTVTEEVRITVDCYYHVGYLYVVVKML